MVWSAVAVRPCARDGQPFGSGSGPVPAVRRPAAVRSGLVGLTVSQWPARSVALRCVAAQCNRCRCAGLSRVELAIAAVRAGGIIVVADDEDR